MKNKHVSAYKTTALNPNRITKKKEPERVSAFHSAEKNRGGLLEGTGYVAGRLGLGLAGVGEGIGDIVSAGGDLLRGDTEMAKYRFLDNRTAEATARLDEWYNPGKGMQFAGDVASGIGQSSVFLLDALAPGLGTGLFFSGITGQSVSGAAQQTGDVGWWEIGYGVASGAAEAALGKLVGAGGKVAGKLGASVTRSTGKAIGQRGISTALTKATGKRLAGMGWSVAKNTLKDAAGEFTEEFAAEYIDTGLMRLFGIDPNASTSFGEALRAGAVGFVSGAAMGAPANVYIYKNSVAAGKDIREAGEVDQLLYRAAATVDVLKEQEAQAREKGRTKATVAEDAGWSGKTAAKGKQAVSNLGAKLKASKTKGYWTKLEKNINAYTSMNEAMRKSDVGDALLGELRGNLFFTNMSYAVEEAEETLKTATDEEIAEWLEGINEEAEKKGNAKTDYTVEDFRNNRDGILSQLASAFWIDEIRRTARGDKAAAETAEAPQTAQEAAGEAGAVQAEEVTAEEQNAATEESAGAEPDPWESVEEIEGFGTQNKQEEELLRAAVSQGVPKRTVPAMLNSYREGTDLTPAEFADAWADGVLIYGRLGFNESLVSKESGLSRMSENARKASIREGRTIADEETKRAQEKAEKKKMPAASEADAKRKQEGGGQIVKGKGLIVNDLSSEQYAAYKAAEAMAHVLGTDIVIETNLGTDSKGRPINGFFDSKTNTIHININAVRDGKHIALYTLGHEVTHYIKEWSPTRFRALGDFVMEKLGQDAETAIMAKLTALKDTEQMKEKTLQEAYDLAHEEVVADGMELILTDGKIVNELARADKSIWQKMKDFIVKVISDIKKYFSGLNQASKTAQVLRGTVESLDEIEQLFYEGVTEAGERTRTAGVETETTVGDKKLSFESEDRITVNMSEERRASILRNKTITPPEIVVPEKFDVSLDDLEKNRKSAVEKPLIKKLREMGYLTEYQTNAIDVSFDFTAAGLRKSMNSQVNDYGGSLGDLAKVVMNMQDILDRSVLIEIHSDKGKGTPRENPQLVQTFVLMSALREGTTITPVQFEIKQFVDNENRLYLAVALTKIKTGVMGDTMSDRNRTSTRLLPVSDISIPQFIEKINPRDEKFFKYIPDEFLNSEQKKAKQRAIAKDEAKYGRKYSVEDTESPDVSEKSFEEAVRRANLSHLLEGNTDSATAEAERSNANAILFTGSDEMRRQLIQDHIALANAMMSEARNQDEYEIAKNYRAKAEELTDLEVNLVGLRKMTFALNKDIDALREKAKKYDDETRPEWLKRELERSQAQKTVWLAEMDALKEKISDEKQKLLAITAAHPFGNLIAEYVKTADAMVRSAERTKQREAERIKAIREKSRKAVYKAKRDATEYKNAVYRTAYAKADEKNQKYRDKLDRLAGESKERGEITARKRTVMRVLGSLETKLYHPTKANHVPKELHDLAMKTLSAADPKAFNKNRANIKEMGELAAKIERLERKADRTAKEQDSMDGWKARYEELEAETIPLRKQAEAMLTAFIEYNEKAPKDLKLDQAFVNIMTNRVKEIEEVPLSRMGLRSLEAVETFVTMLSHQITSANELFVQKKGEQVSEWGNTATREAADAKSLFFLSPRSSEWAGLQKAREYLWKNMKPLTVFEAIGSPKLMELFQAVLDGEEVWITDILEAREAIIKAKETYGYDKWDHTKRHELTTQEGKTVRLTVGELMSLYAYAQREQARGHLTGGGFKLDPRATEITEKNKIRTERALNQSETYKLTELDFGAVESMLTEEQKAYAETVQQYLTSLGEKGNEVSRALYGMDAFTEEHYFPIKVISEVLASQTGKTGDPKIKNRGAFRETTPDAKETILLQDFMKVAAGHVNDIATYHAFVLPVEDLNRVLNYKPTNVKIDENGNWIEDKERKDLRTLKEVITAKYGTQAVTYIEQLLRDINGGARRESAATILDKGLTAFKRSATMLSLSTIVQQPTSIIRAMAYVDGRHFKGASFVPWETVKRYAKVAAIKEMGGHDTSTGARTDEFLNAREYDNQKDKLKAAALGILPESYGGDKQARDEYFGWLTAKADEKAWSYLFGAIVNEQAERLGKPKDSEEVLKAAGKRFTEVVRRTQVYDSTLTRNEYMRSKDGLMKMATAFGAEPATVVSMAVDAMVRAERGDKTFLRKSAAGIAFSIIANAAVASLIYAMRDDDEDETLPEKYVQSVTSELIEGFNPFEYLPVARDVVSLFKGYEIERSDMALIGNLMEQVEMITSSKRSTPDKIFGVTGAVSAFFGVPVTNVYRDVKGLIKTGGSFADSEDQTAAGFGHAVGDAVRGQFNLFSKLFGAESGNAYELYKAYVRGDTAHYERVKARYKTDQEAEIVLRTELRENDKRIAEAAEARLAGELEVYESIIEQIEGEGIFDRGIVIRAINNEMLDIKDQDESKLVPKDEEAAEEEDEEEATESLYTSTDLNNALGRGDTDDFEEIMAALIEHKVGAGKTEAQAKAAVKSSITSYWKKQYVEAWRRGDDEERKRIIAMLTETGLYGSRNDVATTVMKWVQNSK